MNIKRYNEQFIEVWKDIPNYEGYYQASNLGRIRSIDRTLTRSDDRKVRITGKILTPYNEGHDYLMIDLYKDNIRQKCRVHRLIGFTFLSSTYFENAEIDHINFCRWDNRVCNLRWVTRTQNQNHKQPKVHIASNEVA